MKIKPLVPKKIKYNKIKFNLDISKPIAKDSDKDGIPNYLDCAPFDSSKSGILHDWIRKQRLLHERKNMAKLDIEPLKEEQEYFDEELSKAETSIEDFKTKVEDRTGYWKENIKSGFKGTDRNFSRIAKAYDRKPAYQHKKTQKQHPQESSIHPGHMRAVNYLIPAPRKLFGDSSTPDMSFKQTIPRYVPFSPPSVGRGLYKPKTISSPYMEKKRRERELMRLYLRQKLIEEAEEVKN